MRCESCIYYIADGNRCDVREKPIESIDPEKCLLYTRSEGFKTTLYDVLLADGSYVTIDESPLDLKGKWVAVQTYKQMCHPGGFHYEQV